MLGRRALLFAAAAAGLVASTISAPLTAFASEDAARFVLGLSSNCPLCNNFSPFLFSTTKRNFSPLLRISIFPAINVLLVAIGIRVYVARRQDVPARPAVRLLELEEVPMQIVGALDAHRRQITHKTLRVLPSSRRRTAGRAGTTWRRAT